MGNKAIELINKNKDILFAYEEAIGFMCGSKVLDKDGISAGVRVAELAAYLETMNLTLLDKLQEIYQEYVRFCIYQSLKYILIYYNKFIILILYRYGHHISDNSYWICHDPDVVKAIFERLRNYSSKPDTVSIILIFIF